jgi:hypothetical protein
MDGLKTRCSINLCALRAFALKNIQRKEKKEAKQLLITFRVSQVI